MADIYSSTTKTRRGEGQEEQTTQRTETETTRTVSPGAVETIEATPRTKITTSETPGDVLSVSEENRPAITKTEHLPARKTVSIQQAATIIRQAGPKISRQTSDDDYGIALTFKIRIQSITHKLP